MSAKRLLGVVGLVVLVLITGYLSYEFVHRGELINARNIVLNDTLEKLANETLRADGLNATVTLRDADILSLKSDVVEKTTRISQQESLIREIQDVAENQKQEIAHLREVQASLNEEGKIIVDQYGASLVLYDNVDIFEKQSPLMSLVKNDPIKYGKLGIPFIYFRDEARTVENGIILGSYSTLYNYIYIYKDNNEVRTLYHEIAHIIYQKVFVGNGNEDTWVNFYRRLEDAHLLSTEYSAVNEIEGFAEEYSVYKTGMKDQPAEVKSFFAQVDDIIK